MTQLPNDSAPRRASNDEIWALFLGLAVVGLALFGLAGYQPLGWAAKFEEWVVPAKAVKPVAWALPGWLALAASVAAVTSILSL